MTTTTTLPAWADLSDVDKGAVLLHLHKREWEGAAYATQHYPAVFFDHPRLTALASRAACRFAVSVEQDTTGLDDDEHQRLYDLALAEPGLRARWAARGADGYVATTHYSGAPRAAAEDLLAAWSEQNIHGGPDAVLHRTERAGEWHEAGGCDGCRSRS